MGVESLVQLACNISGLGVQSLVQLENFSYHFDMYTGAAQDGRSIYLHTCLCLAMVGLFPVAAICQ